MHNLSSMTVVVSRAETLETLKENRERHATIVAEARKGYVAKAKLALAKRMDELESGKLVALRFSLRVPEDQTAVYDTAIKMLEIHQEDQIEMNASQVRMLVMDEWDWMDQFLVSNAGYSGTAREYARMKGTRIPGDEDA